jgi:hypothetical protein
VPCQPSYISVSGTSSVGTCLLSSRDFGKSSGRALFFGCSCGSSQPESKPPGLPLLGSGKSMVGEKSRLSHKLLIRSVGIRLMRILSGTSQGHKWQNKEFGVQSIHLRVEVCGCDRMPVVLRSNDACLIWRLWLLGCCAVTYAMENPGLPGYEVRALISGIPTFRLLSLEPAHRRFKQVEKAFLSEHLLSFHLRALCRSLMRYMLTSKWRLFVKLRFTIQRTFSKLLYF